MIAFVMRTLWSDPTVQQPEQRHDGSCKSCTTCGAAEQRSGLLWKRQRGSLLQRDIAASYSVAFMQPSRASHGWIKDEQVEEDEPLNHSESARTHVSSGRAKPASNAVNVTAEPTVQTIAAPGRGR
ncbi:hypothetical protein Q8A73_021740 [Channa argus]|nr:hypothetical protein Q8A73_021740 [Channa argus]